MNVTCQAESLSIVIPARNEETGLSRKLPVIRNKYSNAEIIVDDGSTDKTAKICESFNVRLISHPYCMGNEAAIKTGARAAKGETLVYMDADGQHYPDDIPGLLSKLSEGCYIVVGARYSSSQASLCRSFAN
jgi:glycosyltransferase involved in cell wall biosynthesis